MLTWRYARNLDLAQPKTSKNNGDVDDEQSQVTQRMLIVYM